MDKKLILIWDTWYFRISIFRSNAIFAASLRPAMFWSENDKFTRGTPCRFWKFRPTIEIFQKRLKSMAEALMSTGSYVCRHLRQKFDLSFKISAKYRIGQIFIEILEKTVQDENWFETPDIAGFLYSGRMPSFLQVWDLPRLGGKNEKNHKGYPLPFLKFWTQNWKFPKSTQFDAIGFNEHGELYLQIFEANST